MGRSIVIVPNQAHIEEEIYAGVQRFRWSCRCKLDKPWSIREGTRDASAALEAFRQHWASVHIGFRPVIDWYGVHKKIPWLITGDEEHSELETLHRIYGEHATVRVTNLKTGASSTVSGAAMSINMEEEKVGMSRFEDIQARLRELEKEAAKYARFERVDPWPSGTVVVYDQESTTGEKYTYGVLKCANDKWYWTGHGVFTKSGASYDHLVEHLAHDRTSNIRVAVPDDFKPLFPETLVEAVGPEIAAKAEQGLKDIEDGKGVYAVRPGKSG